MKKLKMPKMTLKKMDNKYKSESNDTIYLREGEPTTEYDMTTRYNDRKRKKVKMPKMKLKKVKTYQG